MKTLAKTTLLVGLLFVGTLGAFANSFNFNFNPTSTNGLSVQQYMRNVLGGSGSVTVSGATWGGTYNGDNHVVGPCSQFHCSSLTLGNDETGVSHDNFVINNSPSNDAFTMKFSGIEFNTVSFDLEIFPDASCPKLSQCGGRNNPNLPDFTFYADGQQVSVWFAAVPGQQNTVVGQPAGSTYLHSPDSGSISKELAPQMLLDGDNHVTFVFGTDISTLKFEDWPATIGIDNLKLSYTQTPEPATFVLLGSGLLGLILRKRTQA
ncbi:MAG TPA: PEP-CTERM sorting domain-containing protein [Terriglobales bacterium]|nr:PEP-CTERM sorting domain-containing protein [Terriglobales bacterium]